MDEYLIFLDETKPVKNQSPYFCMSGIIISKDEYIKMAIPKITNLKEKYFRTANVVFHFTDMKKSKNNFEVFQKDSELRTNFWKEYESILKSLDFTSVGVYFEQSIMTSLYLKTSYNSYDIAFVSLLDNIVHFLRDKNAVGQICIESRTLKENSYLQNSYYDYISKGSLYNSSKTIQHHLSALGFLYKGDNCIGLQISDMSPSLLIRKIKFNKGFYGLGDIFYQKLYHAGDNLEEIIGFKDIL